MLQVAVVRQESKHCIGKSSSWQQAGRSKFRFFLEKCCGLHWSAMSKGQSMKWQNFSLKNTPLNLPVNYRQNAVCGKTKMAVWICLMLWDWLWCFGQVKIEKYGSGGVMSDRKWVFILELLRGRIDSW